MNKHAEYSPQMERAIAGLVRSEDDDSPTLTDDEVRGYGLVHDLTKAEIEQLVEIARGPIGY